MARREREGMKKASSRKWFYDINDWVQFEEVEDIEDRARSYFELQVISSSVITSLHACVMKNKYNIRFY